MATEAQLRAIKKWSTEKVDEIKIRVPKGQKAEIQAFAKAHGETVNAFVNRLIRDAMTGLLWRISIPFCCLHKITDICQK